MLRIGVRAALEAEALEAVDVRLGALETVGAHALLNTAGLHRRSRRPLLHRRRHQAHKERHQEHKRGELQAEHGRGRVSATRADAFGLPLFFDWVSFYVAGWGRPWHMPSHVIGWSSGPRTSPVRYPWCGKGVA